jgi:hypothetical protein
MFQFALLKTNLFLRKGTVYKKTKWIQAVNILDLSKGITNTRRAGTCMV